MAALGIPCCFGMVAILFFRWSATCLPPSEETVDAVCYSAGDFVNQVAPIAGKAACVTICPHSAGNVARVCELC